MRMFVGILAFLLPAVVADLYLHNPRGSNDRLNEKSAARQNANRLFDSQNNNRGGYNVGDKTKKAAKIVEDQYRMKYFQSDITSVGNSYLTVEWTNQHGCGGNENTDAEKQNCNLVLQYSCQNAHDNPLGGKLSMRDGLNTNTPAYTNPRKGESVSQRITRRTSNLNSSVKKGQQESWDWYDKCFYRERNKGLFTADQKLKSNNGLGYSSAIYTRQNPNGNRYGYECPEERDYYPYWHPTPWKDIAVLSQNQSLCSFYQSHSFNVKPYGECVETDGGTYKQVSRWNNPTDCSQNGGSWVLFYNYLEKASEYTSESQCSSANNQNIGINFIWQVPYDTTDPNRRECLVALKEPDCIEAPWTRSNHLGNGRDGEPNNYTWVLPYFPSESAQRCVLRMRYNISTDDYDPFNTDYRHNQNKETGIKSPVQQNPYVKIGVGNSPLRLAINTAQYGRVFQDRTHLFILEPRPDRLKGQQKIFNLNVRGKRGNIVQVYPAVEYDFFPTHLSINEEDLVHIQWTGSNTHNNGHPGGDGQTGDAGQGTGGTDRNNFIEIMDQNENYPLPFGQSTMFSNAEVKWITHDNYNLSPRDAAINLASSGYYNCSRQSDCGGESVQSKTKVNALLNDAPASYEGVVLKFRRGRYYYMCTRNNNFTNRSQKGSITVR